VPIPGLPVRRDTSEPDVSITMKRPSESAHSHFSPPPRFFYSTSHLDSDVQPTLRVGVLDSGIYIFCYQDGAKFAVAPNGREVWGDCPANYTLRDAATYLVGPIMGFVLRLRGVVPLHASTVVIAGRAIVLMGGPGAGKSTTAAAFAKLGYSVLCEDVAALTEDGSQFLIQPGYPRVNLWPDSARALFGHRDLLPAITPPWEKQYLALDQDTHRFQEKPLPLGAIFLLGKREPNSSTLKIDEMPTSTGLMYLVANTYVSYLLNGVMRRKEFAVLSNLASTITVYHVRPSDDPARIEELCRALAAVVSKSPPQT
jgi:hypothetical protein